MKFNIKNLDISLQKAITILSNKHDFEISNDGLKLIWNKISDKEIEVKRKENELIILASEKAFFFRAFSEYLFNSENKKFKANFSKIGLMIDNSRNGVTNVEYTKDAIEKIAFMGMNTMYLYIEDTYLLESEPYFGYLRGAYSREELKELDDYADMFGVELVPCIQTLAHINQFFYWEHIARKYADIDDILCVGDKAVNKLIENMIKNFSTTLRSRRIHLGMDEAYNLGRGKYADVNGLKQKPYIMLEHLETLLKICKKYGMSPMIWDDMFFTNYSKLEEHDKDFYIPEGIGLMYWDYYNTHEEHYRERIETRKKIASDVKFAGGAWKWTGYTPHHSKTLKTLKASMKVCKEEGIDEVLITSWSDDGTESPVFNQYLGCLYASEKAYNQSNYEKKCKFYLGVDFNEYMSVEELDCVSGTEKDITPSKYFFYEDPLMSKFVYHNLMIKDDLTKKYKELASNYKKLSEKYEENALLNTYFRFYSVYANILSLKWNLSINIYTGYNNSDKEVLRKEIDKIDKLIDLLTQLQVIRKKLWYMENKRYGLEVLEQRFGGIILRLISTKQDLEEYILHDVKIDELSEKRLPIDEDNVGKNFVHYNRSQRIVSASKMIW